MTDERKAARVVAPRAVAAVLLFARDPEALASFYRDGLGIPLARVSVAGLDSHFACDVGRVYISIWPAGAAGLGSTETPGRAGPALFYSDLESVFGRVSQLPGVEVIFPPRQTPLGTIARLRDPEGNPFELYTP